MPFVELGRAKQDLAIQRFTLKEPSTMH